jgi:O-antigen ligase
MSIFKLKINQPRIILFLVSLPFERLLTFEVGGYTFKLSMLLGLLLLYGFFVNLLAGKIYFKFRSEEIWLLLFNALNFLSYFWSIDKKRTLLISSAILLTTVLFIVFRRFVPTYRKTIETVIVYLGVAAAIFGLWQFIAGSIPGLENWAYLRDQYKSNIFGFPRVQATFLEPLYFANFLILPLFLAIKNAVARSRLFDYISLILITVAFFLTLSRGAEYALIVSILILSFAVATLGRERLLQYSAAIVSILIGIVIGSGMIYLAAGKDGVKSYFGQAVNTSLTTSEGATDRSSTSDVALGVFENNLAGVGAGAFGALPVYKPQIADQGYQIVNNEYLEILAETGIPGFIFFAFFLFSFSAYLIKLIRAGDKESVYLAAAFLAMLIQYLAFSTLYIIYIWIFWAFIWPVQPKKELELEGQNG